uniref:Uncharacterized protein n=1 Tax=Romanomermis culicivorax TaxID=13658 RepID=A0A915KSH8_ROMCU
MLTANSQQINNARIHMTPKTISFMGFSQVPVILRREVPRGAGCPIHNQKAAQRGAVWERTHVVLTFL